MPAAAAGRGRVHSVIVAAAGLGTVIGVLAIGFVSAILLVIAYRRFVQKRAITGPEALKFPERGFGVERQRRLLEKLQRQAQVPGTPSQPPAPMGGGGGRAG